MSNLPSTAVGFACFSNPTRLCTTLCALGLAGLTAIAQPACAQTSDPVAPGAGGLRQLERAGAIRPPHPDEVEAWIEGASRPYRSKLSPNYRFQLQFDYALTRAVTLPAGLHGALSKRFLVLAGVAAPQGDPGHSCVALMDGFRTNSLTSCLVGPHEAIERLQKLPTADSARACRLIDPPANARLEAVSAYRPEGSVSSFRIRPTPVPIAVRVLWPGDIVLVLNVYDPAIWRVSASADTRIAAVLLIGYHTSTVEGIRQDTPVVAADYEGMTQRPISDPICEPFHSYLSSAHNGGPHALLLDRQVQALTGRSLDRLSGDYALKDVELR